jgi:enterochelin esterase-like enzyme
MARNKISATKVVLFLALLLIFRCVTSFSQLPVQQPLESPRLKSLRIELANGSVGPLEAFWKEIKSKGAPLIEEMKGDDKNLLVTFIRRAKEENKYFAVFPMARANPLVHLMSKLSGTDLYYKSYQLRRDARFEYLISNNDSLSAFAVEDPSEKGGWIESLRPDPLNPHTFVEPKDPDSPESAEEISSIIELPNAPKQPFVNPRPGVAKGKVDFVRYASAMLKNERRLWIYTPPGSGQSKEPYGLLVLFDGWQYLQVMGMPTILDNMIADGVISPLVVVMIDHVDRFNELAMNAGFADFVAGELVPWLQRKYYLTKKAQRRIIGGLSLGGVAAAYTAMRHSDVFGNVLTQSGSFQFRADDQDGLIRQFVKTRKLPIHFYLEAGLLETGDSPSLLASNRHLRDVLQAKGYDVKYSEFNGRHDHICWRGSISQGVMSLITNEWSNKSFQRTLQ